MKLTGVKLTVPERHLLPDILPRVGKYEIGRLCVAIGRKLRLTEAEQKKYKVTYIRDPQGTVTMSWDLKRDKGNVIQFTAAELSLIAGTFKQINNNGRLPTSEGFCALYEKFSRFASKNGRKPEVQEKSN